MGCDLGVRRSLQLSPEAWPTVSSSGIRRPFLRPPRRQAWRRSQAAARGAGAACGLGGEDPRARCPGRRGQAEASRPAEGEVRGVAATSLSPSRYPPWGQAARCPQ